MSADETETILPDRPAIPLGRILTHGKPAPKTFGTGTKRLVPLSEYLGNRLHKSFRLFSATTSGILSLWSGLLTVALIFRIFTPHELVDTLPLSVQTIEDVIVERCFAAIAAGLVTVVLFCLSRAQDARLEDIEDVTLLTAANADQLPLEEVLVRSVLIPPQDAPESLLRPARTIPETEPEQLLRPHAGC